MGCPTSTAGLARACWAAIERRAAGILHWSDAGVASWYDFAVAIGELGEQCGLLERAAKVQPISTADYLTGPAPQLFLARLHSHARPAGSHSQHWWTLNESP